MSAFGAHDALRLPSAVAVTSGGDICEEMKGFGWCRGVAIHNEKSCAPKALV